MRAYKTSSGAWQLNFMKDGSRRTLYLGRGYTSSSADRIAKTITDVVAHHRRNETLPADIVHKIESFPDRIRQNMERIGLRVDCRTKTLSELCRAKIESVRQGSVKPATVQKYQEVSARLLKFFGGDRKLISVTKIEADQFRQDWLRTSSESTVSRGIRMCRTIFRFAVDQDWLAKDPFAKVAAGYEVNADRQIYVSRQTIRDVMQACERDSDRLILALARFGGLRIPSEIRDLRFSDFVGNVIKIGKDTKTGAREVPFFTEIREEFGRIVPPADLSGRIFGKLGGFRLRIQRAICRAGFLVWEKLFVNLRSSCITDLAERGYSDKTLNAIFGNSAAVRARHYIQFRREREYSRVLSEDALLLKLDRSGEFLNVPDDILLQKVREILGCPGENSGGNLPGVKVLAVPFGASRHAG